MIDFKLTNVLLGVEDFLEGFEEVYFRHTLPLDGIPKEENSELAGETSYAQGVLEFDGEIDFLTYFNALSLIKWKQYSKIDNVWLHLELAGAECLFTPVGVKSGQETISSLGASLPISSGEHFQSFDCELPFEDAILLSFTLVTSGKVRLKNAYFYTKIEQDLLNSVNLAICMTTFKREEYVLHNIDLIKKHVLGTSEAIAQNMQLLVVDNGRTLSIDAIEEAGVSVYANKNTGGSGGFARGMIEALQSESDFTHIILMDDDVKVSPESFIRTYNLLSLTTEEYQSAFISGAMLILEEPNVQFEDVSYVTGLGAYKKIKPNLNIDELAQVVISETTSLEVANAYAAWWYCGIPLQAVRDCGLPLPFFVRYDDVDYGVRCGQKFMAMNGICVWHAGFEDRYNAAVDCYQSYRNFPITAIMNNLADEKVLFLRMMRNAQLQLRNMAYESVELMLDGYEDFLKGPEFLLALDGEELIKKNGARGEKLVPVSELDQDVIAQLEINYESLGIENEPSFLLKLWRTLPYDRHLLPEFLLREKPASIFYSFIRKPNLKSVGCKTLVALDSTAENGAIRHMDKVRYRRIKQRISKIKKLHDTQYNTVRQAYVDAKEKLISIENWKLYLDI